MDVGDEGGGRGCGASAKEMWLEACVGYGMSEIPLVVEDLLVELSLLLVE